MFSLMREIVLGGLVYNGFLLVLSFGAIIVMGVVGILEGISGNSFPV